MSIELLTPAMAQVLDAVRRAGAAPFYKMSVPDARAAYIERSEVLELPRAVLARVEDLQVPGAGRQMLNARLYASHAPAAANEAAPPVLLYLHGGGFVIGGVPTHDSLCRQWARLTGALVLSLEYRLAPEHRFPTAVDDCWAVLRWLMEGGAKSLGADPSRVAVAGDSAGGTLSAVCAILARDHGLPLKGQVLITPGTASESSHPSHQRFAKGYLLEAEGIDWFFAHYISADERRDWRFAPLIADDLAGLAPAYVLLAECDPLVDEGLAYADRLRAAGSPVELELTRGVTHDFIKMGRAIPQAVQVQADIGRFLREVLA
jgi:acetyl esterase